MQAQTFSKPVEVQATSATSRARAPRSEHIIPGFAHPGDGAGRAEWNAAFEDAYVSASGDLGSVPWGRGGPDPTLVSWLDTQAPGLLRPGATVAVVGCGTGDDAAELATRGYDVTAFDVSPTAIDWARRRFGHISNCFLQADLLDPPAERGVPARRADLVVEVDTLSWLPVEMRQDAAAAIAGLARPRGMVVAIAGRTPAELTAVELCELMATQGMIPLEPLDGEARLCAAFRRA